MTIEQQAQLQILLEEMGLTHSDYHGKLYVNYHGGNIINYGKEETIKLTEKRR